MDKFVADKRMTDAKDISSSGNNAPENDLPPGCLNAFIALQIQRYSMRAKRHPLFARHAEWRVLCALTLASLEDRATDITTLVADSGMPRSTVKRVIDLLVQRGEVRLERSDDDRRRIMVIQSLQAVVTTLKDLIAVTFEFSDSYRNRAPNA